MQEIWILNGTMDDLKMLFGYFQSFSIQENQYLVWKLFLGRSGLPIKIPLNSKSSNFGNFCRNIQNYSNFEINKCCQLRFDRIKLDTLAIWVQWRTQEKISGGGVQGRGSGLVGGPGGGAPRTPENFRKFAKNPEENCKKCCIFAYFTNKFQNHAVNFRAFGRKTQLFGKF